MGPMCQNDTLWMMPRSLAGLVPSQDTVHLFPHWRLSIMLTPRLFYTSLVPLALSPPSTASATTTAWTPFSKAAR
jgi:hypothetical protein